MATRDYIQLYLELYIALGSLITMSEFRRNECVNCHTQFPAYCAYCPECGFKQSSSVELTQASPGKADAASDGQVHSGTEGQEKGTPSTSHIEFGPTESLSTRIVATDVPAQQLEDAITYTKESGGSDQHKPCCSQNRTKQTGVLQTSTPNAADLPLTNFKHEEKSQASDCSHLSKAPSLTSDDQQVCCTVHACTNV